jgi:hypothetical protein
VRAFRACRWGAVHRLEWRPLSSFVGITCCPEGERIVPRLKMPSCSSGWMAGWENTSPSRPRACVICEGAREERASERARGVSVVVLL